MRALAEVAAVLLVAGVLMVYVNVRVVRPWRMKRHIDSMIRENERIDDYVNDNR